MARLPRFFTCDSLLGYISEHRRLSIPKTYSYLLRVATGFASQCCRCFLLGFSCVCVFQDVCSKSVSKRPWRTPVYVPVVVYTATLLILFAGKVSTRQVACWFGFKKLSSFGFFQFKSTSLETWGLELRQPGCAIDVTQSHFVALIWNMDVFIWFLSMFKTWFCVNL